jgi:AcrR family transcriptional regulator
MNNRTSAAATPNGHPLGRPRSKEIHQAILGEALQQVLDVGFRAVSIESIAARTGIGKTTIYRRWPNKAAVVMDALLQEMGPVIPFPTTPKAAESIQLQMRALAKALRGRFGSLIKAILGEAQFDPELAEAFRERWIRPRRQLAKATFEEGMRNGELRPDLNIDTAIDALYGGIYYRVQTGNGPLSEAYVDELFRHVMDGLRKHAA